MNRGCCKVICGVPTTLQSYAIENERSLFLTFLLLCPVELWTLEICHLLASWIFLRTLSATWISVFGSISSQTRAFFSQSLLSRSMTHRYKYMDRIAERISFIFGTREIYCYLSILACCSGFCNTCTWKSKEPPVLGRHQLLLLQYM